MCRGGRPLGFGFGVGDDADTQVGLDIGGYDISCGQLSTLQRGYLICKLSKN